MKYRIATFFECEALTDLRMQMRKELDSNFNSELIYAGVQICPVTQNTSKISIRANADFQIKKGGNALVL